MSVPARPGLVSVVTLVTLMILALSAPVLAFSAVLIHQNEEVRRAEIRLRASAAVDQLVQTLDREFRGFATMLGVLAASDAAKTGDIAALHRLATATLADQDIHVIGLDADLQQLFNTRRPLGEPLPTTTEFSSARRALESGEVEISGVFMGPVAGVPVFDLAQRVDAAGPLDALMIGRDADTLEQLFAETRSTLAGWSYAVLDPAGVLAAGAAPVGVSAEQLRYMCRSPLLEENAVRAMGQVYLGAGERVEPWGWSVCAWAEAREVAAPGAARWRQFLLIGATLIAVATLAGVLLGRSLSRALKRAAEGSRALAAGDPWTPRSSGVIEIDEVMQALARMSDVRRRREDELRLLLRETAHRAKNKLAIAGALVRLSARTAGSVEQLRDDVELRLQALARSVDSMQPGAATGDASVERLIETQLEPFLDGQRQRLALDGPETHVSPVVTQALGLALHELATNAAKYGAWSRPEGLVRIAWRIENGGLVLDWREEGGPPAGPPQRAGFGTLLIDLLIQRNLGGAVERRFEAAGFSCTLRLPSLRAE